MIQILINNEMLDLSPDANTSFQQNSPFFDPTQIQGEYSLPVELVCTDKNLRLLGYVNELAAGRDKVKINTVTWAEDGLPLYIGTLITESVSSSLGQNSGKISAYFICGISNFYQIIKDMKMQDIDMGGMIYFADWTALSTAINNAYSLTSDNCDYVFAPIIDENAGGAQEPTWDRINAIKISTIATDTYRAEISDTANTFTLVPMPYLIVVIRKLFQMTGYSISGNILSDPDFKKIILPNFQSINDNVSSSQRFSFDLKRHLPDLSVGDFIISIMNKFGIGFQFDNNKKSCQFVRLNDLVIGSTRRDFSKKTDLDFKINFAEDTQVFSFTQTYDSNDSAISDPDFSKVNLKGEVLNIASLPALTSAQENDCYLCQHENIYYYKAYDPATFNYYWGPFADNIYDYKQPNGTNTIDSKATCLGMRLMNIDVDNSFIGWIANSMHELNWPAKAGAYVSWGLRLMLYHGMQTNTNNGVSTTYPFCSHSNYFNDTKVSNWNLSYINGTSGLIDTFWLKWLKILSSNEDVDFVLYPELYEFMQIQWSDIFLINNVPYLLSQRTPRSPFNGNLPVKARRIQL